MKELALFLCSILAAKNRKLRSELEDKNLLNLYLFRRYQQLKAKLDYISSGEWLKELIDEVRSVKESVKETLERDDLILHILAECVTLLALTIEEVRRYVANKLPPEDYNIIYKMTTVELKTTLIAIELLRNLLSTSKV